jgi:hypothetical protein
MNVFAIVSEVFYLQHGFLGVGVIIYEIIRESDERPTKEYPFGSFRH